MIEILSKKHLCFDTEVPDGNNLGQYANQPLVFESFWKIKEKSTKPNPEIDKHDWREVEAETHTACNVEYKVVGEQLMMVAKNNIPVNKKQEELYANYGGLWSYWIPAELEDPGCFEGEISWIIVWLFDSPLCN
jgi:hypothetical protein